MDAPIDDYLCNMQDANAPIFMRPQSQMYGHTDIYDRTDHEICSDDEDYMYPDY